MPDKRYTLTVDGKQRTVKADVFNQNIDKFANDMPSATIRMKSSDGSTRDVRMDALNSAYDLGYSPVETDQVIYVNTQDPSKQKQKAQQPTQTPTPTPSRGEGSPAQSGQNTPAAASPQRARNTRGAQVPQASPKEETPLRPQQPVAAVSQEAAKSEEEGGLLQRLFGGPQPVTTQGAGYVPPVATQAVAPQQPTPGPSRGEGSPVQASQARSAPGAQEQEEREAERGLVASGQITGKADTRSKEARNALPYQLQPLHIETNGAAFEMGDSALAEQSGMSAPKAGAKGAGGYGTYVEPRLYQRFLDEAAKIFAERANKAVEQGGSYSFNDAVRGPVLEYIKHTPGFFGDTAAADNILRKVENAYWMQVGAQQADGLAKQLPDLGGHWWLGDSDTQTIAARKEALQKMWASAATQAEIYNQAQAMGIKPSVYIDEYLKPELKKAVNDRWPGGWDKAVDALGSGYDPNMLAEQEAADKIMGDAVEQPIAAAIEKFDQLAMAARNASFKEQGSMAGMPMGMRLGAVTEARMKGNAASDPQKILDYLTGQLQAIVGDPQLQKSVRERAKRLGISPGDYMKSFVKPRIEGLLQEEFNKAEIAKLMPKGSLDYVLGTGLRNTILGQVARKVTQSDYQNWLEDMAASQYDAGFWETVGSGGVTFAGDMWSYLIPGGVGGKVTQGMARRATEKIASGLVEHGMERAAAERAAAEILRKNLGQRLVQGATSGAVTFGGQSVIATPANEIYKNGQPDATSKDGKYHASVLGTVGKTVEKVASGAVLGALMQGTPVANFFAEGRGVAANVLADVGGGAVDASLMAGQGLLDRMKEDPTFTPTGKDMAESIAESFVSLKMLGAQHSIGKYWGWKDKQEMNRKYHFTDEDLKVLRDRGYSDLYDAFATMGSGHTPGQQLDGAEVEAVNRLTPEYRDFLQDPTVSEVTKTKMMAVVEGRRPANFSPVTHTAVATSDDGKSSVLTMYNAEGGVVDRRTYRTAAQAEEAQRKLDYTTSLNATAALEAAYDHAATSKELQEQYDAMSAGEGPMLGSERAEQAAWLMEHNGTVRAFQEKRQRGEMLTDEESAMIGEYQRRYDEYRAGYDRMGEYARNFEESHGLGDGYLSEALLGHTKKEAEDLAAATGDEVVQVGDHWRTMQEASAVRAYQEQLRRELTSEPQEPTQPTPALPKGGGEAPHEGEGATGGLTAQSSQNPPRAQEGPTPPEGHTPPGGVMPPAGPAGAGPLTSQNTPSAPISQENTAGRRDVAYDRGKGVVDNEGQLPVIAYEASLADARLDALVPDELKNALRQAIGEGDTEMAEELLARNGERLSDDQREAVEQWLDAQETLHGIDDAVEEQSMQFEESRRAELAPLAASDGTVREITLKDGSTVYYKSGDLGNQYGGIIAVDENGQARQVPVRDIMEVGEASTLDELVEEEVNDFASALDESYRSLQDGRAMEVGSQREVSIGGEVFPVTVAGMDNDGNITFSLPDGSQVAMRPEEASAAVQQANQQRIAATLEQERTTRAQAAAQAQAAAAQERANAEAAARQARFENGIVGLKEGNPDYGHKDTDAKVAADYLRGYAEENGTDMKKMQDRIRERQAGLHRQELDAKRLLERQEQWKELYWDTFSEEERATKERIMAEQRQKMADAQQRQRKWAEIRDALMTDEERAQLRNERGRQVDASRDKALSSLDKHSTTAPAGIDRQSLLDNHATMTDAQSYLDGLRQELRSTWRNGGEQDLNNVRFTLGEYQQGRTELTEREVDELTARQAALEQQEQDTLDQLTAIKKVEKTLPMVYKERNEGEDKNLPAAEQRKRRLDRARRKNDMQSLLDAAREEYHDLGMDERLLVDEPESVEELVAMNLAPKSINWEARDVGIHHLRGLKEELGTKRGFGRKGDTGGFNYFLAPKGQGKSIDRIVHDIWEARPDNLESLTTQDVRNALLDMLASAQKPTDISHYVAESRIAELEQYLQQQEQSYEEMALAEEAAAHHMTAAEYESYLDHLEDVLPEIAESRAEAQSFLDDVAAHEAELLNARNEQYGTEQQPPAAAGGHEVGVGGSRRVDQEPQPRGARGGDGEGARALQGAAPDEPEDGGHHHPQQEPHSTAEAGAHRHDEADGGLPVSETASGGVGAVPGTRHVEAAVKAAEQEVDTHPTESQKKAGNYKKGHVKVAGFDVTIENPKGSERSGTDANGKKWSVTMQNTYGYIRGTEGVDGDHIDVFLANDMDKWDGKHVYVVDQYNPDGTFDEHKVMMGFNDPFAAYMGYLSNYSPDWRETRKLQSQEVSLDDFKKWIASSHRKTKPFAEYVSVKSKSTMAEEPGAPLSAQSSPTAQNASSGYRIEDTQYTTKKGKVLDVQRVAFDEDLPKSVWKDAQTLAKSLRGWHDRGSWLLRSPEDAKEFADGVMELMEAEPTPSPSRGEGSTKAEVPSAQEPQSAPAVAGDPVEAVLDEADRRKGEVPVQAVNVAGLFDALNTKGEARLRDHAEDITNTDSDETSEQTAADTRAVASEGTSVAVEAEAAAEGATTDEEVSVAQDKVDGALGKVNKQLALLGYYAADRTGEPHETYGYMKSAEKKALKDANTLARQLAKGLGTDIGRKNVATANIAPVGGDITMRLYVPGTNATVYVNLGLEVDGDDLNLERLMFRVELCDEHGHVTRRTPNIFTDVDVTLDNLVSQVNKLVEHEVAGYKPAPPLKRDGTPSKPRGSKKAPKSTDTQLSLFDQPEPTGESKVSDVVAPINGKVEAAIGETGSELKRPLEDPAEANDGQAREEAIEAFLMGYTDVVERAKMRDELMSANSHTSGGGTNAEFIDYCISSSLPWEAHVFYSPKTHAAKYYMSSGGGGRFDITRAEYEYAVFRGMPSDFVEEKKRWIKRKHGVYNLADVNKRLETISTMPPIMANTKGVRKAVENLRWLQNQMMKDMVRDIRSGAFEMKDDSQRRTLQRWVDEAVAALGGATEEQAVAINEAINEADALLKDYDERKTKQFQEVERSPLGSNQFPTNGQEQEATAIRELMDAAKSGKPQEPGSRAWRTVEDLEKKRLYDQGYTLDEADSKWLETRDKIQEALDWAAPKQGEDATKSENPLQVTENGVSLPEKSNSKNNDKQGTETTGGSPERGAEPRDAGLGTDAPGADGGLRPAGAGDAPQQSGVKSRPKGHRGNDAGRKSGTATPGLFDFGDTGDAPERAPGAVRVPAAGGGARPSDGRGGADNRRGPETDAGAQPEGGEVTPPKTPRRPDNGSVKTASEQEKPLNTRNYLYPKDAAAIDSLSPKERLKINVRALSILRDCILQGRTATDAERAELGKFRGWGGTDAVRWYTVDHMRANPDDAVRDLGNILADLDPDGKLDLLQKVKDASLSSFYTPVEVATAINHFVERAGYAGGGTFLDGSFGSGVLEGTMPKSMQQRTAIYGTELDWLTAQIAKQLYPDANIKNMGFEKLEMPAGYFDVVGSNIPFGSFGVQDLTWDKSNDPVKKFAKGKIHNYFTVKKIELLKPGGIGYIMTSNGILDSKSNQIIRKYIADNCEILGVVRLPDNTFKGAGTKVVTDVIMLRKYRDAADAAETRHRPDYRQKIEAPFLDTWMQAVPSRYGQPVTVEYNGYFGAHPEMMIGDVKAGGQYRDDEFGLTSKLSTEEIAQQMTQLIDKHVVPAGRKGMLYDTHKTVREVQEAVRESYKGNGDYVSNGNLVEQDGKFGVLVTTKGDGGKSIEFQEVSGLKAHAAKIRALQPLRKAMKQIIAEEISGADDARLKSLRSALKKAYGDYVGKFGRLHDKKNAYIEQDIDGFTLKSLEHYEDGKFTGLSDIFEKSTIKATLNLESAKTPQEVMTMSLAEYGEIRPEFMEARLGKDWLQSFDGSVFALPDGSGYQTKDLYLSGNVKAKLAEARLAAQHDPRYEANVKALEAVQPQDLPFTAIGIHMGARWVPEHIYTEFLCQKLGITEHQHRSGVSYMPETDTFNVTVSNTETSGAYRDWCTDHKGAAEIFEAALKNDKLSIYVTDRDGNRIFLEEETNSANEKIEQLREDFEDFISSDQGRVKELETLYNEKFNTTIVPKYDGSHLQVPGLQGKTLRPHQKDAIWMLINNGGGIIDHIVGAGKTLVMQGAIMEMRRMGIAKKPMIIALKSTVAQMGKEFREAFPAARILAPTEKDFTAQKRKQLLSNIALNDWDCVILSHEQFGKLPHTEEVEQGIIREQIDQLVAAMSDLREGGLTELTKKQLKGLEKRKKSLEAKLEKLMTRDVDREFTFESLGVDYLFVDECQQFKNLPYVTTHQNVAGLSSPEGSGRATALLCAARYLQGLHQGDKGLTLLSGTTISNSLVELYSLFSYVRPNKMQELGFTTFDAWAANFAQNTAELEYNYMNQLVTSSRFRNFDNVPELAKLYAEVADVRNDNNLKLPKPGMNVHVVTVPSNPALDKITQECIRMCKEKDGSYFGISNKTASGKNQPFALLSTTISTKAAINVKLVDPSLDDGDGGKIRYVCDNVKQLYDKFAAQKGTQMIFCDLGVPSPEAEYDVYNDIINRLVDDYGIPREEIVDIHTANTDQKKAALFKKMNDGDVRVLIAGSKNGGTGVNVQKRMVAIHHVDMSWNPANITQENGRGARQGNEVARDHNGNKVEVFYYATEHSLDLYKYQLVSTKQNMIDRFKIATTGDERSFDEGAAADDKDFDPASVVALLSGNPIILEKAKTDKLVQKLIKSKRQYMVEHAQKIAAYEMDQQELKKFEGLVKKNADDRKVLADAGFKPDKNGKYPADVTVSSNHEPKGTHYDKPGEAGKRINYLLNSGDKVTLEAYGMKASVYTDTEDRDLNGLPVRVVEMRTPSGLPVRGAVSRDDTAAGVTMRKMLQAVIESGDRWQKQIDFYKHRLEGGEPGEAKFPKEAELEKLLAEKKRIDAEYAKLSEDKPKDEAPQKNKDAAPIKPRTSHQLFDEYGQRWLEDQETSSGAHSTQIRSTEKTYVKIGRWLQRESERTGKKLTVLDASSGLGYGTMALRGESESGIFAY